MNIHSERVKIHLILLKQLEESYAYLSLCNRTTAIFKGLERIEKSDYPEEALREALPNALVHRDYSYSGSIIINVNNSCMEFISIGGLLPGLSAEDIRSGISQPRNRRLAEITSQMKIVLDYLAEYQEMTEEELQELLNIKKTRAYLLARQMSENGLIDIIGRGAGKKYKLK